MTARRYAIFALVASLLTLSLAASTTAHGPDGNGGDTPAASGPSCTKTITCIVLQRKGLSKKRSGGYFDPDATVKVTIARNARGIPARVVDVELRNVDSKCWGYDENGKWVMTPGPEVSANLEPLALQKTTTEHVDGNVSTVFRLDPLRAVRTINGYRHELSMELYEGGIAKAFEPQFSIEPGGDDCNIDVNGTNDPLKRIATAEEKQAVARCKKMPADTKKQRRKRANCLDKARY